MVNIMFANKTQSCNVFIENQFTLICVLVAMTKKDMLTNGQLLAEKLTLPFCTVLMKMPPQIKNMKWGDYLVRTKIYSVNLFVPVHYFEPYIKILETARKTKPS